MNAIYLKDNTIQEFIDALGSALPAPGGGAAAGVSGSLGAALGKMVTELTLKREKYAEFHPICSESREQLSALIESFLNLADDDAAAYDGYMQAIRMPKNTETEIQARDESLKKAIQHSTAIPCRMILVCMETMDILEEMQNHINPSCRGDLAAAAAQIEACARIAWLNILANLQCFSDKDEAYEIFDRYAELRYEVVERSRDIYEAVEASF